MIGTVNTDLEPMLSISVLDSHGNSRSITAVVDTGYNGYLTLPPAVIATLNLSWISTQEGELADGSVETFDLFEGRVLWDGQTRVIEVDAMPSQPLLGMALMRDHDLHVRVADGGTVRIAAIP